MRLITYLPPMPWYIPRYGPKIRISKYSILKQLSCGEYSSRPKAGMNHHAPGMYSSLIRDSTIKARCTTVYLKHSTLRRITSL